MNRPLSISFRVDGTPDIGAGHVMRCLTLARSALARGDQVQFAAAPLPSGLRDQITASGARIIDLRPEQTPQQDAAQCLADPEFARADWVVLDHYGLNQEWQALVRNHQRRLCVFEDQPTRPHLADVLLDPTYAPHAPDRYAGLVPASCSLLLGPSFALVRPEFLAAAQTRSAPPEARDQWHLFVCLGGGEVSEATACVLRALSGVWPHVTLVMAQTGPAQAEINAMMAQNTGWALHISPKNFAQLMADADLAITGSGSISWEKCALGLPSIAVCLADNQRDIFDGLDAAGAHLACPLETPAIAARLASLSPEMLRTTGAQAQAICGGRGVTAVLNSFNAA